MEPSEVCVGCGAGVPKIEGPIHRYMTSAPACWAMFGEINGHMHGPGAAAARWQLAVDAYAVQHPGGRSDQAVRSVAIHLLSLYAQVELALPGVAAHAVLVRAAAMKAGYHWLAPPANPGWVTVGHVLERLGDPVQAVEEWGVQAWQGWSVHHPQVVRWYSELR